MSVIEVEASKKYTIAESAEILGVTEKSINHAMGRGSLSYSLEERKDRMGRMRSLRVVSGASLAQYDAHRRRTHAPLARRAGDDIAKRARITIREGV